MLWADWWPFAAFSHRINLCRCPRPGSAGLSPSRQSKRIFLANPTGCSPHGHFRRVNHGIELHLGSALVAVAMAMYLSHRQRMTMASSLSLPAQGLSSSIPTVIRRHVGSWRSSAEELLCYQPLARSAGAVSLVSPADTLVARPSFLAESIIPA